MNRSEKNVIRDSQGCVHLGGGRTLKHLFGKRGAGSQQFAKSIYINNTVHTYVCVYVCMYVCMYICICMYTYVSMYYARMMYIYIYTMYMVIYV